MTTPLPYDGPGPNRWGFEVGDHVKVHGYTGIWHVEIATESIITVQGFCDGEKRILSINLRETPVQKIPTRITPMPKAKMPEDAFITIAHLRQLAPCLIDGHTAGKAVLIESQTEKVFNLRNPDRKDRLRHEAWICARCGVVYEQKEGK